MFFRHGSLINWLTFPGVIIRELSHQLLCRFYGIPVFKVVYFQTRNPSGYVLHETPDNQLQSIILRVGPFVINTILGFIIALPAAVPSFELDTPKAIQYMFAYLGVSITIQAFPSTGDAKSALSKVKQKNTPIFLKLIGIPITGLIYLNTLKNFSWVRLLYGIIIAILLPHLLIKLLA